MVDRDEIESALDALGDDGEGLDVIHLHAPVWLRALLDENAALRMDVAELRRDVERLRREVEARPEINVEDAAIAFVYSADDTTPAQYFMSVTRIEEALEAHGRKMIHAQKAGE